LKLAEVKIKRKGSEEQEEKKETVETKEDNKEASEIKSLLA
jgi:hypothetical protein